MGMTFTAVFLDFGATTLSFSLSERLREISVFFLERSTSSASTRSCLGEKVGLFVPIRVSFIEEQLVESELLGSLSGASLLVLHVVIESK